MLVEEKEEIKSFYLFRAWDQACCSQSQLLPLKINMLLWLRYQTLSREIQIEIIFQWWSCPCERRVPLTRANRSVCALARCLHGPVPKGPWPSTRPQPGVGNPVLRVLCGLCEVALNHTRLSFLTYLGASSHGPSACVPWRMVQVTFLNGICGVRVDVL